MQDRIALKYQKDIKRELKLTASQLAESYRINQSTVEYPQIQNEHQKPVALMEYLIKTYTNEGETVLDFTMGSGSTGVACTNTNRKFIGIERDDKYFDISVKRIRGEL